MMHGTPNLESAIIKLSSGNFLTSIGSNFRFPCHVLGLNFKTSTTAKAIAQRPPAATMDLPFAFSLHLPRSHRAILRNRLKRFVAPFPKQKYSCRRMATASAGDELSSIIDKLGLGKVTANVQSGSSGWASMRTFTTDKGETYFAKLSREDPSMFLGEAESLRSLFRTGTVRVPEVFDAGKLKSAQASFILMEKLTLQSVYGMSQLGRAVAELHLASPVLPEAEAGQFGFNVDNTIGSTTQPNPWMDDWVNFFRQHRLRHQARLTADLEIIDLVDKLCANLDVFFEDIRGDIKPSLIHGDLWSGNISGCDGDVVIFDPASYYAHHEAEFGMSWCAGFTQNFWKAYRELIPEAPNFKKRKPLYQLYHYLNHYNLFGGGYYSAVKSILTDLTRDSHPGQVPTAQAYDL